MSQLSSRTCRVSFWLGVSCYAAIALMLGYALFALLTPDFLVTQAIDKVFHEPVTWTIGPLARILLLVLGLVTLSAVLYTLWHTARLFSLYSTGEAISATTSETISRIGIGLLAQAAMSFFGTTLTGLILSIGAPEGRGILVIAIKGPEIGFALAGGLMMLIGLVMLQAVEAVRENREFV